MAVRRGNDGYRGPRDRAAREEQCRSRSPPNSGPCRHRSATGRYGRARWRWSAAWSQAPARSVRRGRWHGGRPGRRAGTADRGQLLEEVVARHGDPAEEETAQLRHWLDIQAKRNTVLTFGGGVNEIQRELIATAGLGLPRVPR